jgi:UPF0271 protein
MAVKSNTKLAINCDMGESFGLYKMGDDEGMMPHITIANVACGFHASDPSVMAHTVRLAKQHHVSVGAHPSLPDLQGFGRREMKMRPEELTDSIIYQVGALKGFLQREGMELFHVKPHGSLYGMAARSEEVAKAVANAAKIFNVPVLGMAGTMHEKVYTAEGLVLFPNTTPTLTTTMMARSSSRGSIRRSIRYAPPRAHCARSKRVSRSRSTARK